MSSTTKLTSSLERVERKQDQYLRAQIVSFYEQYQFLGNEKDENQLFTAQDKEEALAFFDGKEEEISAEELHLRRNRCVLILDKTKEWARNYKSAFLRQLGALDIAFDRKKALRKEFCSHSFKHKAQLFELVQREAERIRSKKAEQIAEQNTFKEQFLAFYTTHSIYFCYEDRLLAWENVVISLQQFRTHRGKINRLQALFAMLPSNLAYARNLDERFQTLLLTHEAVDWRKESRLAAFRASTFEQKLKQIDELEKSPTIAEQKKLAEQKKEHNQESMANVALYTQLYEQFPHGLSPAEFQKLSLTEQEITLQTKAHTNNEEEKLLQQVLSLSEISSEEKIKFKKLTQTEKKKHIETILLGQRKTPATNNQTDTPNNTLQPLQPLRICSIVVKVLHNKDKHIFVDDQERLKVIKSKMAQEGVLGEVNEIHLKHIRALATTLSEAESESPKGLQWIDARLRERIYIGESKAA